MSHVEEIVQESEEWVREELGDEYLEDAEDE